MQAYYEIETDIPKNHQLHLLLPDDIPAGKAKVAIIYELIPTGNGADHALKTFLEKYQTEALDIDTAIFDESRKTVVERDFKL